MCIEVIVCNVIVVFFWDTVYSLFGHLAEQAKLEIRGNA